MAVGFHVVYKKTDRAMAAARLAQRLAAAGHDIQFLPFGKAEPVHPAWDDKTRIQPEASEDADQQRRAADAVYIVVTQHHDVLARRDGASHARRTLLDVVQQERVVELAENRAQKTRGRLRVGQATAQKQLRQHLADTDAPAERLNLVRG